MPIYNIKHFWIHRRTAGNVNPEVFFIGHPDDHASKTGRERPLWAWGGNGVGQLGDSTTEERHSPSRISSIH